MWREHSDGPVLVGSRCSACGLSTFPERAFCRRCWADSMEPVELSRTGRLYTWTTVHAAQPGYPTPSVLGYVDLPEGVRVLAPLDVVEAELRAGLALALTLGPVRFEDDGTAVTGYRFRTVAA